MQPWIEDYNKEYQKGIDELMPRYNQFISMDMTKLEDWELKDAFDEFISLYRRSANLHFIWMYAYCIAFAMFEEMCQETLDIDRNDLLFNDLLGGFDHKLIETDRRMFNLGSKAKELGLEPLFKDTPDDEELLSKLAASENGKVWLQELNDFLNEFGWRTIGNWDASNPTWVEKPALCFPSIRRFMEAPAFVVDANRQRLIENREAAVKDVLSRVPAEKKEQFTKLLRASQWAQVVEEEHPFYTENYGTAIARIVTKEIGKRFAERGAIDAPEDVYFLLPEEIQPRIFSCYSAKKIVAERKKQHKAFRSAEPEPFIGDPSTLPEVIGVDPLLRSSVAPNPRVRPELGADLYGTVSTPGVVEGSVNLLMSEDEMHQFVPGSILVTVETSSLWTPLFNMAKAVITDVGGILSHSAIVGREYGLPVISGTVEGTKKLKTGMRVKVDGDAGVVYILDK
jgi:phosphohistidine swiveling domain-containing protein